MQTVTPQTTVQDPKVIDDAISIIQEHLDREARNRRQVTLDPKDLCPMQKARLVTDLTNVLDEQPSGSAIGRAFRSMFGGIGSFFRGRA